MTSGKEHYLVSRIESYATPGFPDCVVFHRDTGFFTLELNLLEEKQIDQLFNFEGLKKFKTWIDVARTYKPHQLDKKLEKLMKDKNVSFMFSSVL